MLLIQNDVLFLHLINIEPSASLFLYVLVMCNMTHSIVYVVLVSCWFVLLLFRVLASILGVFCVVQFFSCLGIICCILFLVRLSCF